MKVKNNSKKSLVVFTWHLKRGRSDETVIEPGETRGLDWIYLGEAGKNGCYFGFEGCLVCQDTPDDEHGVQITSDKQIDVRLGDYGITIRQYQGKKIL